MVTARCCLVVLLLQTLGYLVFLRGFFPPKIVLPDVSSFSDEISPFENAGEPHFDRLVIMVVDAMRSDFMYSSENSKMSYLHSLIHRGIAIPYTAHSDPPTVTLPRLKAITTGGTPSFIDAILNVADENDQSQSLAKSDSWLRQLKMNGKNRTFHFFGDDTWLKLYPPDLYFEKFDGTSSFFVSDFTEVDNNVTRHLENELKSDEWDVLILHYLGMDHIGHKGGPHSPFMAPKQIEMDNVVREIFELTIENSPSTLMVLMGDHGMNEVGNHGGSSKGETSPGMVLISQKLSDTSLGSPCPVAHRLNFDYYNSISQIDIVPTLAALFNFPIPRNNLGVIMPEVLKLWDTELAKKKVLFENCKQFMALLRESYGLNEQRYAEIMHEYLELESPESGVPELLQFLKKYQSTLSASATKYSYPSLAIGFTLIVISFFCSLLILKAYFHRELNENNPQIAWLVGPSALFALHYHGSSLIEEEHQLWWLAMVFLLVWFSFHQSLSGLCNLTVVMLCLRLIKGWNDSGQKVSSSVTIAKFVLESSTALWILVAMTYGVISMLLVRTAIRLAHGFHLHQSKSLKIAKLVWGIFLTVMVGILAAISATFKASQTHLDGQKYPAWLGSFSARFCDLIGVCGPSQTWISQECNIQLSRMFTGGLTGLLFLRILVGGKLTLKSHFIEDFLNLSTLGLIHQSRVETIPIYLLFTIMRISIYRIGWPRTSNADWVSPVLCKTTFVLCVQNLTFFSIGNTNLLATIDLTNAYNGISEYNVALVGVLTFISNFGTALYWSLAGLQLMSHESISDDRPARENEVHHFKRAMFLRSSILLLFYSICMINLTASCFNLRFHLFIWSVFSPKLLYFASWSILVNFLVDFAYALCIVTVC